VSTIPPGPPVAGGAQSEGDELDGDAAVRRRLLIATSALGGAGLVATAVPFVKSLDPSAQARAQGGPVETDIAALAPGMLTTVVWRGRPVWLLRRTPEMVASLGRDTALLADPASARSDQPAACRNPYRSLKPELGVIIGVCTHLGCTPNLQKQDAAGSGSLGNDRPGGFLCPCHGSKFDLAGRVFRNMPAPTNLVIPPYAYLSSTLVRIGDPTT